MGHREARRVPLDFNWPMNKVWEGYLNPHYKECPEVAKGNCHNGYSNAGKWLEAICRLLAMVGEEGEQSSPEYQAHFKKTGRIYPHPYLQNWENAPRTEVPHAVHQRISEIDSQTERMRELHRYLRDNPPRLLPLDSELASLVKRLADGQDLGPLAGSNVSWAIQRKILKAAGIRERDRWGVCKVCKGDALDPTVKRKYDRWKPKEPPKGDGWQLWETTSEGSPISPVFPTADALAAWCETNASVFANERTSKANWLKMFVNDTTSIGSLLVSTGGQFGAAVNMGIPAEKANQT